MIRLRDAASAFLVATLLTSCGLVPNQPGEIPNYIPDMPAAAPAQGNLTKYGFSEAQRIAVRVRNISCTDVIRGTGFAIDSRTLVTNKHVVEGTNLLHVPQHRGKRSRDWRPYQRRWFPKRKRIDRFPGYGFAVHTGSPQ